MKSLIINAIQTGGVEMATALRSSGKIYIVILTMLIIFSGLITVLLLQEKKLKNLEERVKNKSK